MSDPVAPRARIRLPNVLRAFSDAPWAILPEKLDAILGVVDAHAAGAALPAMANPYAARRDALRNRTPGAVALVPIYGTLTQRAGLMTDMSGATSAESVGLAIDAAAADPNVGTIVLDIDSPGGSTAGIPEVAAKIRAARATKRVVAVANSLCASAAYWLAAQADEIVAAPSAIVGSIGVFAVHTDTSGADAQDGVRHTVFSFGAHKADGMFGPLSEDGAASLQAMVDEQGQAFVAAVAAGRGVTPAAVRAQYGDGAVFAAGRAHEAGLVDRVASLEDVLASLGVSAPRPAARLAAAKALAADTPAPDLAASAAALTLAEPHAVLAVAGALPLADARAGAFGTLTTAQSSPAPEARSYPVDPVTTAANGAAPNTPGTIDLSAAIAADRTRVANIRAMAAQTANVAIPAGQVDAWIANGTSAGDVGLEILALQRTQAAAAPQITVGADRSAQKPFASVAHQLAAVVRSAKTGQVDARLLEINAAQGTASSSSADAGFVIQQDFAPGIVSRVWDQGQILGDVTKTPVSGNGFKENVLKENSRVNGARNGGILGYWIGEAGTITPSKPEMRQAETSLNKVAAAWYATEETIEDAPALEAEVSRLVPQELTFQTEDKIYNGTGAGVPLGVLNSSALITQAIEATQTIANSAQFFPLNFAKMFNRMPARSVLRAKWYVNQEVMSNVMTMTLGAGSAAIPVWLPPNGLAGAPFGTILGRPILPIEYAAAQGTVGDILFADFSDYRVIDKGGVNQAGSIHVSFLTDEQVFKWTYRVGGQPMTNSPITPYKGSATLSPYVALQARS